MKQKQTTNIWRNPFDYSLLLILEGQKYKLITIRKRTIKKELRKIRDSIAWSSMVEKIWVSTFWLNSLVSFIPLEKSNILAVSYLFLCLNMFSFPLDPTDIVQVLKKCI